MYIHLNVKPSERFVRSGMDIHSKLRIHLLQAVMGAEVEIDTIHGKEKIKIPAGTEDGKVFKLSGKGVHSANGGVGDHLAKTHIEVPKKLSKREKELYAQLAEEAGVDVKNGGGLFG